MKKIAFIPLSILALHVGSLWAEKTLTNGDGFVGNIYLHGLFFHLWLFFGVLLLVLLFIKSTIPTLKNIGFTSFIFLIFWGFLELIAWGLIQTNILKTKPPSHGLFLSDATLKNARRPFWGDYCTFSGKWRLPNDTLSFMRCDGKTKLYFKTNNYGCRDRQRSVADTAKKGRIIWLGDSFVEGQMVNVEDRTSNRLEAYTGHEHLNFGINGTATLEYYLRYKYQAKYFDHKAVIVSVLPANDFGYYNHTDEEKENLISFPIYRPYTLSNNNTTVRYSLANITQSYASATNYNHPQKQTIVRDSIFHNSLSFLQKTKILFSTNSYLWAVVVALQKSRNGSLPAFYEKFSNEGWNALRGNLGRLFVESKQKKMIVLIYPIHQDVVNYKTSGVNELTPALEKFCKSYGVQTIDLLPVFASHPDPASLYVPCDGHLNETGEEFVTNFLLKNEVYQGLLRD